MGEVHQCCWRICREINVSFSVSNITCFTFYIHLWAICWLFLVRRINRDYLLKEHGQISLYKGDLIFSV
jgi:hypothetical protein